MATVESQTISPIVNTFIDHFFVALYEQDDGSDPNYESNVLSFKTVFTQLASEMKVTLSHGSVTGLTQSENRQAFANRTKDQGASWGALSKAEKDIWSAVAKRVPPKADAKRASNGWDCYRKFGGNLPPLGDGVSVIPCPSK